MCLINPIIEQKSDDLSDRYREEGNKKFISQNLDEKIIASLWLYNKVRSRKPSLLLINVI